MNKKITTLAFIALLTALSGCGSSDTTTTTTSTDPDTTDPDTDPDPVVTEPTVAIGDLRLVSEIGVSTEANQVAIVGIGTETLSASGSTTVKVNIVNAGDSYSRYSGLVNVYFTSTCVQGGFAEFTPSQILASGSATATYQDKGCGKVLGNEDSVSASIVTLLENGDIDEVYATAPATIDVAAAQVGAIQFVQAIPAAIALRGVGSDALPELSVVEFMVVDKSGNLMTEREVTFSLDHNIGGVELSKTETVTDQDGIARVQLQSGHANGNVRVIASIAVADPENEGQTITVTTQSNPIAMSTGLGDENSFSLSAVSRNPAAFDWDGTQVQLNVRLADHFQNPVPDGTRVSFTATGGYIDGSCELVNGTCPVTWTSSDPRPIDGVVTITARSVGEGNYQDINSNGMFDIGERYQTYGEVFIDANGNGVFDVNATYQPDLDIDGDGDNLDPDNVNNEFHWNNDDYIAAISDNATSTSDATDSANIFEEFFDFNNDGELTNSDDKNYQGVNCSDEVVDGVTATELGHCNELVDISTSLRMEMSASTSVYLEGPFAWSDALNRYDTSSIASCIEVTSQSQNVAWRVSDSYERRNHLPTGTKIAFVTDDLDVVSESGTGDVASVGPVDVYPVWSAAWDADPANASRTIADKKYDYLNARGHLLEATVQRPDTVETNTGLGKIQARIETVNGPVYSSSILDANLLGYSATLVEGNRGVSAIDISGGVESYTIYIQNKCGLGLNESDTLGLDVSNGTLSNVTTSGGAGSVSAIVDNQATVEIDSTAVTIVSFDITPDGTSNPDTAGFTATRFEFNGTFNVPSTSYIYAVQD